MRVDWEPGAIVASRYRLDRFLGEGGMGSVWAATHTITQRRYALKFLKGPAHAREELRRRFAREARAASAVVHPNVVVVHDVFELDDETPVMVMDLLEGESLRTRLKREGALSVEDAAGILLPAVSAVGAAHAVGIVHRDLKPDNIFLERSKSGQVHVRVLDFGIAKLVAGEGATMDTGGLTGTGALLGTPVYMSPEQGFGERDIDHRADIWALGVVLYEALSGIRPVEGENIGQVLKRLLNDGITPLEVLEPDLPTELTALVRSMLSREREDRPEDLRDVAEVLKRFTDVEVPQFGAPASEMVAAESSELPSRPAVVVDSGASHDGETEQVAIAPDTHGPTSISVAGRPAAAVRYAAVALLAMGSAGAGWLWWGGDAGSDAEPIREAVASVPASETPPPDISAAPVAARVAPLAVRPDGGAASARVREAAVAETPPASPRPRRAPRLAPKRAPKPSPRAAPRPDPPPAPAPAAPRAPRSQGLVDEPPF